MYRRSSLRPRRVTSKTSPNGAAPAEAPTAGRNGWVANELRDALVWDGHEKFNLGGDWLRFLAGYSFGPLGTPQRPNGRVSGYCEPEVGTYEPVEIVVMDGVVAARRFNVPLLWDLLGAPGEDMDHDLDEAETLDNAMSELSNGTIGGANRAFADFLAFAPLDQLGELREFIELLIEFLPSECILGQLLAREQPIRGHAAAILGSTTQGVRARRRAIRGRRCE
jgi:hypothetical protein